MVVVVGPHTSNTDFVLCLALRSAVKMDSIKFLAKKELFDSPFGFLFRWIGGTPVDRKSSNSLVEQVVKQFHENENFVLALAPEGTRKKVERLKTGFYHIAKIAEVPVLMVGLDYKHKHIIFSEPFIPANEEEDFKKIFSFFGSIQGKVPENGMSHFL